MTGRIEPGGGIRTLEKGSPPTLIFANHSATVPLLVSNRAEVAQLVEHSPEKAGVDSSILSLGTTTPLKIFRSPAPDQATRNKHFRGFSGSF